MDKLYVGNRKLSGGINKRVGLLTRGMIRFDGGEMRFNGGEIGFDGRVMRFNGREIGFGGGEMRFKGREMRFEGFLYWSGGTVSELFYTFGTLNVIN
jgi:hypothetical protein